MSRSLAPMNMLLHVAKGTWWLRSLRWGDYPGLSGWVPCNHRIFLRARWESPSQRIYDNGSRGQRGEKMLSYWLWGWGRGPQAKECRWALEGKEQILLSELLKQHSRHLEFLAQCNWFWAPDLQTMRQPTCVVSSHSICGHLLQQQ